MLLFEDYSTSEETQQQKPTNRASREKKMEKTKADAGFPNITNQGTSDKDTTQLKHLNTASGELEVFRVTFWENLPNHHMDTYCVSAVSFYTYMLLFNILRKHLIKSN